MAAAPVNQFEVARKRAAQQEASNLQGQNDAIKRRMASMGGGPSGAMVKLENQARDDSAKRLADANEGIDVQEHAENRRIAEIKEGRDFQRGEREASQLFSRGEREASQLFGSGEAEKGRLFSRGEREAAQTWQSGEAKLGREFATSERLGSETFAAAESKLGRDQQQDQFDKTMTFNQARAQMDDWWKKVSYETQKEQFDKNFNFGVDQFRHQQFVDKKNLDLAARIQGYNEGLEDPGLLGMGGVLGTGLGGRGGLLGTGIGRKKGGKYKLW
jgi:hypothetical protein